MADTPTIFLSYSWKNKDVANLIDEDFQRIGLLMQRDVRDGEFRQSIKEFMLNLRKMDYVLTIISDDFLKSENCLFELLELFNTRELEKRILPIILNNAKIYHINERVLYYDFWDKKIEYYRHNLIKYTSIDFQHGLTHARNIRNQIPEILSILSDLNTKSFESLRENNYKEVLSLIGFEEKGILTESLRIRKIDDREERDLQLEELFSLHPKNKYVMFYKAYIASENKEFKKAKRYYENTTNSYPDYAVAQNNFGLLLQEEFSDFDNARIHFEKALEVNPKFANAHYNYALLLKNVFKNYEEAKFHYLEGLKINPEDPDIHGNYALLLKNEFKDYDAARIHFETALKINPKNIDIRSNYAILLSDIYRDYEGARAQYISILEENDKYHLTHYNFANLLSNGLKEYFLAKYHLEEALRIKPDFFEAHINYANLLRAHFSQFLQAKEHYKIGLELNSNVAQAHLNYSKLLIYDLNDAQTSREHYLKAIELDPNLKSPVVEKKLKELLD